MTGVALGRGADVIGRLDLSILGQVSPAVACRTLPDHGGTMDHHRGRPGCKALAMASVALRTSGYVAERLGHGIDRDIAATVAGRTLSGQSGVVHLGRLETQLILVAGVACCGGRDVVGRLAQRLGAIVAGRADAGRIGMNEAHSCPGCRR